MLNSDGKFCEEGGLRGGVVKAFFVDHLSPVKFFQTVFRTSAFYTNYPPAPDFHIAGY